LRQDLKFGRNGFEGNLWQAGWQLKVEFGNRSSDLVEAQQGARVQLVAQARSRQPLEGQDLVAFGPTAPALEAQPVGRPQGPDRLPGRLVAVASVQFQDDAFGGTRSHQLSDVTALGLVGQRD